jgi:ribosome-associated protein
MLEKQAQDIIIMDLRGLTSIADYFVICTASVDVHMRAIVNHVEQSLYKQDDPVKPIRTEGKQHLNWVLQDLGDIIVHIFLPDSRSHFRLEQLWGDAPVETVEESA